MFEGCLEHLETLRRDHETLRNGYGMTMKTVKNSERLGTFEPIRSDALERIVENVHVHALKTKEQMFILRLTLILFQKFVFVFNEKLFG